jgi:hypothetical protein
MRAKTKKDLVKSVLDSQAKKLKVEDLPKGLKPSKVLAHRLAKRKGYK